MKVETTLDKNNPIYDDLRNCKFCGKQCMAIIEHENLWANALMFDIKTTCDEAWKDMTSWAHKDDDVNEVPAIKARNNKESYLISAVDKENLVKNWNDIMGMDEVADIIAKLMEAENAVKT